MVPISRLRWLECTPARTPTDDFMAGTRNVVRCAGLIGDQMHATDAVLVTPTSGDKGAAGVATVQPTWRWFVGEAVNDLELVPGFAEGHIHGE